MRPSAVFLKKECREIWRTYKIYVLPAIFLFFGLTSPLLAKLAPELVKMAAKGITIVIPAPTAVDAYGQFLKNLNQIGMLAVIFTSIGLVAEEKTRGTAALLLTKPVPRWSFVVSKFAAGSALVLVSTALSYLACLYYTVVIFKTALLRASFLATVLMAAYYLLILAVTVLASTLSRSVALSGGISVAAFLVLSILPVLHPVLARYSPGALADYEGKLLTGAADFARAVPALAVTLGLAAVLVAVSVAVFRRQEL